MLKGVPSGCARFFVFVGAMNNFAKFFSKFLQNLGSAFLRSRDVGAVKKFSKFLQHFCKIWAALF